MNNKRVAFATLGCKVNQYESAALEELFRRRGYAVVDFAKPADVYVINTCTVTHMGDRKSRQLIRRAVRTNPRAVVTVTGCYAQTAPGEVLDMEGVDLVVGAGSRAGIVDLVEKAVKGRKTSAVRDISGCRDFEELPGEANQGRVRAFLKIQEGCRNFCSYCIVPYARGPLRSRPPESVLAGAGELLARGFKEIVLTGINTGAYGRESGGKANLAGLLEKLAALPGLLRLRLSSLEPRDITPELLQMMASGPPFCRHLHVPLQSGDDQILKSMGRNYDAGFFRAMLAKVRKMLPGVGITTDVMVGFPGETDEHFNNTLSFVEEMQFSGLHVFRYSPRRGTPAAEFPHRVDPPAMEERSRRMICLGRELSRRFAARYLGQTVEVLVEGFASGEESEALEGFTDNYVRFFISGPSGLEGQLVPVRAGGVSGTGLKGRII